MSSFVLVTCIAVAQLKINVMAAPPGAKDIDIPGNLWIPNIRADNSNQPAASSTNHLNLALGDYKIGDIITELVVSGGKVKSSENNLVEGGSEEHDDDVHDFNRRRFDSNKKQNNDYEHCNDPSSKIILYHMDNFEWAPSQQTRSSRPLVLMTEVYQLGRFDGKDRGQKKFNSIYVCGNKRTMLLGNI